MRVAAALYGDAILTQFSDRLRAGLRALDIAARYGGEEFVIAMPETDLPQAIIAAERLRRAVAKECFRLPDGEVANSVTVSVGVAEVYRGESSDSVMKRADTALYRAKAEGRNRTVAAQRKSQAA